MVTMVVIVVVVDDDDDAVEKALDGSGVPSTTQSWLEHSSWYVM